jgi:CBS-domain-containing membrane protein
MSNGTKSMGRDSIPVLTDADILDAMSRLPGYLDITTEDFRALYLLAYEHAVERLVGNLRAKDLMRSAEDGILPRLTARSAAEVMAGRHLKSVPVTDEKGIVVGILSETDILRRVGAETFLELTLQPPDKRADLDLLLDETVVGDVMTSPVVTVGPDAEFEVILRAFQCHRGRRMPVVDAQGRLLGIIARKDFLGAYPRGLAA